MKRLKIGIVGIGSISAYTHMPALSALSEKFDFLAIAELNEEIGRKYAKKYNVRYYKNHLEMMDNEDLDVVDICTAPITHHILIYDAAKRGININVEKPMTMTLPIADFVLEVVKSSNVHFQVSENYPCMPWDIVINRMLEKGMFGEPAGAWIRTPVNPFNFDIFVHHYTQIRQFIRCLPTSVFATLKKSKLLSNRHKVEASNYPALADDIFGCYGSSLIEFENEVNGSIEFFPFPYNGRDADYYYSGDLRRLVGTKMMVTDNMWPMILPGRGQKEEFHVFHFNENNTFEKIPVEVEKDSFDGNEYLRKITVNTDPVIEWEIPSSATFGKIMDEDDIRHSFNCRLPWRTAMMQLYENLYNNIVSGDDPKIDPIYRESVEVCVASIQSAFVEKNRVELPLKKFTEYEKSYHRKYRDKINEDVFDFVKNDDRHYFSRIYKNGRYQHPAVK